MGMRMDNTAGRRNKEMKRGYNKMGDKDLYSKVTEERRKIMRRK